MRLPGYKKLKGLSRWTRAKFTGRALVLGYHRVANDRWDPFSLSVSPEHFQEQLSVIRELGQPVSLDQATQADRKAPGSRRAVAVTFDDGYADILYAVAPALKRCSVRATVFVVSGCLGSEPWWDRLARLLAPWQSVPDEVLRHLPTGTRYVSSRPEKRMQLLGHLHRALVTWTPPSRTDFLNSLEISAGAATDSEPRHRLLSASELVELGRDPLVEIGSHSESHPVLADVPPGQLTREICRSKERLEQLLDRDIVSFSYPNGSSPQEAVAAVRRAGYARACTSCPDAVRESSDHLCLPRFWVPDIDGKTFRRWLRLRLP